MKRIIILGLFLSLCFFHEVSGQSESVKIVRFEIDGKEVKKNYKVFFRSNDKWIESKKTSTGFIIPPELRSNKYSTVLIVLGKYKLAFSEIHHSKFEEDWVVVIDNKPFSEENTYLVEDDKIKRIYYIRFVGSALETMLVVQEK